MIKDITITDEPVEIYAEGGFAPNTPLTIQNNSLQSVIVAEATGDTTDGFIVNSRKHENSVCYVDDQHAEVWVRPAGHNAGQAQVITVQGTAV